MMEGVKEIQPLGGPKYYVVVNTKKGQAEIVHEGMPAAGREGFIVDMEEKGFEIMEYDLLVPGRHRHHDEKNDGDHSSSSSSSRSMSAPKARTSDDVITMDYNAFIAGVSDESCGSVTSMFETELISNTKKGHQANDVANEAMMSNIGREDLMKDDGYAVYEHDQADESPSPTNRGDMSSKMRKINPRDNSGELTGTTKTKTKKTIKESTPRPRRSVKNFLRPRVEKYYTHVKEETANMKKAWVLSSDWSSKVS